MQEEFKIVSIINCYSYNTMNQQTLAIVKCYYYFIDSFMNVFGIYLLIIIALF